MAVGKSLVLWPRYENRDSSRIWLDNTWLSKNHTFVSVDQLHNLMIPDVTFTPTSSHIVDGAPRWCPLRNTKGRLYVSPSAVSNQACSDAVLALKVSSEDVDAVFVSGSRIRDSSTRQPLCQVLQKGRYTAVNHTRDIFFISLSYTWTTEE